MGIHRNEDICLRLCWQPTAGEMLDVKADGNDVVRGLVSTQRIKKRPKSKKEEPLENVFRAPRGRHGPSRWPFSAGHRCNVSVTRVISGFNTHVEVATTRLATPRARVSSLLGWKLSPVVFYHLLCL